MRPSLSNLGPIANALCLASAAFAFAASAQTQSSSTTQTLLSDAQQSVWISKVEETERGHRIGNPEAGSQLIEFVSYTCSHCADFVKQSGPTLDLVAVAPGHVAVEVRPIIRNGVDLAVTQLARCGGPEKFKDLHRMFFYTQETWLAKAVSAPASQKAIWQRGGAAGRLNAAQALDLDDMVAARGLTLPQINACLSDEASAQAILAADKGDRADFNVPGTPTFALNGETLEGVHSWAQLSAVLQSSVQIPGTAAKDGE